ncbi:MAG: rhodanese-like domain-containing protein [Bacteroidota bacterium]
MKFYKISFTLLLILSISGSCIDSSTYNNGSKDTSPSSSDTIVERISSQTRIENITTQEYGEKLAEIPEAIQIDVRTPAEFEIGFIPGAINIDVKAADFPEQIAKLDPTKTYFVNCKAGSRSMRACKVMQAQGFTNLYNLEGGILAWQKAGNEVELP